jgi:hypothetical protein
LPDFQVIADVSATLVAVLTGALEAVDPLGTGTTAPIATLHDLHQTPTPPGQAAGVLAVTLVEAREDAGSRNRPRVRKKNPANNGRVKQQKAPMALQLRYLFTPWSKDVQGQLPDEERKLEHKILGRVAQVFYDQPVISGNDLKGQTLDSSTEALKIVLAPLTFEEQTRFWHAVNQRYRASLTYDVRVVNLDPIQSVSSTLVSSREIQYGMVEN